MQKFTSRTGIRIPKSANSWLTRIACQKVPRILADAHQDLNTARMASNASQVVAVVSAPENIIRLYTHNAANHSLSAWNSLVGHSNSITDISFGTESTCYEGYIVSSSLDGYIIGWNLQTGEPQIQIRPPKGREMMSCAMNSKFIAGVGEFGVAVWDIETLELLAWDPDIHTELVTFCRFHPTDEKLLFTGSDDCMINVFDLGEAMNTSEAKRFELDECLDLVLPVEQPVSRFSFGGEQNEILLAISVNEEFSAWSLESGEQISKPNCMRDIMNRLVIDMVGISEEDLMDSTEGVQEVKSIAVDDEEAARIDAELRRLDEERDLEKRQRMLRLITGEEELKDMETAEFSDLIQINNDQFGNSVLDFPVTSVTVGVTVVPARIPDKGWRVMGLIGARVNSESKTVEIAASTFQGGLIIASVSSENVQLVAVVPPTTGHIDIIRDCVWGPEAACIISCGQDARIVLHRRVDVESDDADRDAEIRTRKRVKALQFRSKGVVSDPLSISNLNSSNIQGQGKPNNARPQNGRR